MTQQTLYSWRKQAREQGQPVPGKKSTPDQWSHETKFAVVVATATFSESELGEYCRKNGLYPEQEHQIILETCNESEYANLPPSHIVPISHDDGIYHASESIYYRVLKQANQLYQSALSFFTSSQSREHIFVTRFASLTKSIQAIEQASTMSS